MTAVAPAQTEVVSRTRWLVLTPKGRNEEASIMDWVRLNDEDLGRAGMMPIAAITPETVHTTSEERIP